GARVGGWRRFTVGGWRPLVLQAGARSFGSAVYRFNRCVEDVGYLVCVESEDVARGEDGDLGGGQQPEGGRQGGGGGYAPPRGGPPGRAARRSHLRGGRREMARAIRLRRAGSARAVQPRARPTPWQVVGWPNAAR